MHTYIHLSLCVCTHVHVYDNKIKLFIFTEEEHLCPGQMCGKIHSHLAGGHINWQSLFWITAGW